MSDLFSDRENGPRPRTVTTIGQTTWDGILALIMARRNDGSLGFGFPDPCPDSGDPCGTDIMSFDRYIAAHVPEIREAIGTSNVPPTLAILDLLEVVADAVGAPFERNYHNYMRHRHLGFDRAAGLRRFVYDVNRILARNRIAFEMDEVGRIRRFGPHILRDVLDNATFRTGDSDTDRLLAVAMERILSRNTQDQVDALEKLWDAFERIKTLEPGLDKKTQIRMLLDRAANGTVPKFREVLENEALALTDIGNDFRIRHSETNKEPLPYPEQIDALFHRMFAFLSFVLIRTGRGA